MTAKWRREQGTRYHLDASCGLGLLCMSIHILLNQLYSLVPFGALCGSLLHQGIPHTGPGTEPSGSGKTKGGSIRFNGQEKNQLSICATALPWKTRGKAAGWTPWCDGIMTCDCCFKRSPLGTVFCEQVKSMLQVCLVTWPQPSTWTWRLDHRKTGCPTPPRESPCLSWGLLREAGLCRSPLSCFLVFRAPSVPRKKTLLSAKPASSMLSEFMYSEECLLNQNVSFLEVK